MASHWGRKRSNAAGLEAFFGWAKIARSDHRQRFTSLAIDSPFYYS